MNRPCITLLTDYGAGGPFVGALHAVAFGIAPAVPVIDLDHSVPSQAVRVGAHRLERLMRHIAGGVHVAVVDPGVGSARRPVAIETPAHVLVGPDNGLLVWAARACGPLVRVSVLEAEEYWLTPRARTFDGRDVFVPVAAHVAAGVPLAKLGPEVDPASLVELPAPVMSVGAEGVVTAEVMDEDSFGNLQLAASASVLGAFAAGQTVAVAPAGRAGAGASAGAGATGVTGRPPAVPGDPGPGGRSATAVVGTTFADAPAGTLVLYLDSDDLLALAVNRGQAAGTIGAHVGDLVTLSPAPAV